MQTFSFDDFNHPFRHTLVYDAKFASVSEVHFTAEMLPLYCEDHPPMSGAHCTIPEFRSPKLSTIITNISLHIIKTNKRSR